MDLRQRRSFAKCAQNCALCVSDHAVVGMEILI
jgi:hypothetical protein